MPIVESRPVGKYTLTEVPYCAYNQRKSLYFVDGKGLIVRGKKFNLDEQEKSRKLFINLSKEYDIKIPRYKIVKDSFYRGDENPILLVQKIEGLDLYKTSFEKNDFDKKQKSQELTNKISSYASDVYFKGGDFLNDLGEEQFIWGRRVGETEDNFYLVDVEPSFLRYIPGNPYDGVGLRVFMERLFVRVAGMVSFFERQYGDGSCVEARQRLKAVIQDVFSKNSELEHFVKTHHSGLYKYA